MRYLLDTTVVSALRVRGRNQPVEAWAASVPLADADRVLPFDVSAARVLAAYRLPEHAPLDDALIAAIAESAGMTVVTRNTKHFELLGAACLSAWHP